MGSKLLNPSKWPSSWRLTQEAKSLAAACRAVVSGGRIWVVQVEGCWRRTYTGSYEMRRSVMESQENIKLKQQEPKTWPKVAIIVLNWNGWQDTIECLESLQRLTYPNYQIIVVDNGSTDDSVEKIKAWAQGEIPGESKFIHFNPNNKPLEWIEYDRITAEAGGAIDKETRISEFPSNRKLVFIQTGENLGFAGGNNVGVRYALRHSYNYVCILNNDVVVNPEFLTTLVDYANRVPNVGIAGPLICSYYKPQKVESMGGAISLWTGRVPRLGSRLLVTKVQTKLPFFVHYVSGCAMLIDTKVFKTIGFFDEQFFLSFEDTDFCYRARQAGFLVQVVLASQVWHKESASTPTPIGRYYSVRNRLLFMKKHAKLWHWITFLICYILGSIKQAIWLALGRKDLRSALAIGKGVLDGLKILMLKGGL